MWSKPLFGRTAGMLKPARGEGLKETNSSRLANQSSRCFSTIYLKLMTTETRNFQKSFFIFIQCNYHYHCPYFCAFSIGRLGLFLVWEVLERKVVRPGWEGGGVTYKEVERQQRQRGTHQHQHATHFPPPSTCPPHPAHMKTTTSTLRKTTIKRTVAWMPPTFPHNPPPAAVYILLTV